MTTLTINTAANSVNTILSLPTVSSFDKKTMTGKDNISYTSAPKSWYRKSSARLSSIDWDLNMNELEFE